MNTNNFIHNIFILRFLSIAHSYIKNFNFEHMQANRRTCLDRNIHSYNCIPKLKTCFRHHTAHLQKVMSTKTASDSSLTYFRLFQNLSFSCPTWLNKLKFTKNHFCVLFYCAKSIPDHYRTSKNFTIFFSKI